MPPGMIEDMEADIAAMEQGHAAEPEPEPAAAPEEPQPDESDGGESAPEKEPAVAEEAKPDGSDEYRNVSRALEEERRARRDAERQHERDMAVLADRLERIQQAQQAPREPEPDPSADLPEHIRTGKPTVSIDDDLAEYIRQRDEISDHRDQIYLNERRQREQAEQQRGQQQQLMGAIQAHEHQFASQQPDYYQAVAHLRNDRIAELMETGMNQQQAMAQTSQDEIYIASQALRSRKSPAEVVYALAKRRGYQAPDTPGEGSGNGAGNGQHQEQRPAAQKQSGPDMERLAAGAAEARTLGAAGGSSAAAGKLTPDALLKMSNAEFEVALSKMTKAQQREIMGG